ncbi:hypothetical protein GOP47_0014721 [Adiantum capillus-veneris]|uniref:DCD domain-containing protein n=1 Tax=Adiantum capillus-veneris TaxID=13818 RepID=A0A9D4UM13_ADICA|nr:hypothetical protein GOP47_0014721 [Adiantum capillus-veneris]
MRLRPLWKTSLFLKKRKDATKCSCVGASADVGEQRGYEARIGGRVAKPQEGKWLQAPQRTTDLPQLGLRCSSLKSSGPLLVCQFDSLLRGAANFTSSPSPISRIIWLRKICSEKVWRGRNPRKRDNMALQMQAQYLYRPVAGFILICNNQTKHECFREKVFGLHKTKQELAKRVKEGAKLFLFNHDLKTVEGIYEAISDGYLNPRPAYNQPFGGQYPVQIRFRFYKAYNLPLTESEFDGAGISSNYDADYRRVINQKLSDGQVRKLSAALRTKYFAQRSRVQRPLRPAANPYTRPGTASSMAGARPSLRNIHFQLLP